MIEIGAIPRASTFAAAAPWNTSRSQCEIPSEPNVLDQRQQAVDAVTPLSFFSRRRQIVSGNQLSGPAISGAIDQSTPMAATNIPIAAHWSVASNRHRHSAPTTGMAQSP